MIITSTVEFATQKDLIRITIMPQKSGKANRAIKESYFQISLELSQYKSEADFTGYDM